MGYTTDFTGSVSVQPPLTAAEADYLRRFAESRRFTRIDGPYALHEDGFRGPRIIDYNRPPEGQPSLWCDFAPTGDGTGIEWNGAEKFHDAEIWMQYLIDTFLKSGAAVQGELAEPVAGRTYDPAFEHLTFDHVVNGTIEAQGEDPDDTWRLVVRANAVEKIAPQITWPDEEN